MIEAPLIAADRFPVALLSDDGVILAEKARVILTVPDDRGFGRFVAWTSPEHVVRDSPYDRENSRFGARADDWFVLTDLGEVIVRPLGGCGCGDRLKHWTPPEFQPYRLGRRLR